MDFGINWNLKDARMVAQPEYDMVANSKTVDERQARKLQAKGKMFTKSLQVINTTCISELADYRASLVAKDDPSVCKEKLELLHKAYIKNYK